LPAGVQVTLGPTYILSSFTPVVDVTPGIAGVFGLSFPLSTTKAAP
jgi:hypothetical protein